MNICESKQKKHFYLLCLPFVICSKNYEKQILTLDCTRNLMINFFNSVCAESGWRRRNGWYRPFSVFSNIYFFLFVLSLWYLKLITITKTLLHTFSQNMMVSCMNQGYCSSISTNFQKSCIIWSHPNKMKIAIFLLQCII